MRSLKNIFHCALFLIISLSGVAGVFILLNAEFLAAAQVLIYVGAVAILMVFAISMWVLAIGEDGFEKPYNAVPYYFFWGVMLQIAVPKGFTRSKQGARRGLVPRPRPRQRSLRWDQNW